MLKKVLCVLIGIGIFSVSAAAADLGLSAKSAVLMVAQTGEVLYEENAHEQRSMASTTKIMTALLTLEKGDLKKKIRVTDNMLKVEGTSMGLVAGDTVSVEGLVYGMLLQSGNDAANCAAITVGGNMENFVKMMNSRAKEIGMANTNFVTPSGLDSGEHYSTAYDMALLGSAAIKNADFRFICSQSSASLEYGNPPYKRWMTNHNRLLRDYAWAIGIKTGFTKKSGRCLVSAAKKDGVTLVAVTLNDPNDWRDHKAMLEYGFKQTENKKQSYDLTGIRVPVYGGMQNSVSVKLAGEPYVVQSGGSQAVTCSYYINRYVHAPVDEGEYVGNIVYRMGGKEVLRLPVEAAERVNSVPCQPKKEKVSFFERIRLWIKSLFEKRKD